MTNWIYKPLASGRGINMDASDMAPAIRLNEMVPDLKTCIACGVCTATCTAGALTSFNFRKLHTLVRRGQYAGAAQEAQKCMLCGKCILACPRGINTRGVIVALRKLL